MPKRLPLLLIAPLNVLPGFGATLYLGWRKAFCVLICLALIFVAMVVTRVIATPSGLLLLILTVLVGYWTSFFTFFTVRSLVTSNVIISLLTGMALASILGTTLLSRESVLGINFFYIPSGSMVPALLPGDVVLVDGWAYKQRGPKVGDIVVFDMPNSQLVFVKRVIEASDTTFSAAGDNTADSLPTRYFASIPNEFLRGRVAFVLFNFGQHTDLRLFLAPDENFDRPTQ